MHRLIHDHLEEVLQEDDVLLDDEVLLESNRKNTPAFAHLAECGECREEVAAMRRHASMLRTLRPPQSADAEAPRPGFYARVMERIEAQRPIDIWQLFFDSSIGRRVAIASMALAVLFSVYLVSSERLAQPIRITVEDRPGMTLSGLPDKDTVLVDLVTYREQ
jgi:predicted anti-sigma-YlaC factor YlaD